MHKNGFLIGIHVCPESVASTGLTPDYVAGLKAQSRAEMATDSGQYPNSLPLAPFSKGDLRATQRCAARATQCVKFTQNA